MKTEKKEQKSHHTPGPWRSVAVEGGWNGVADSGGAIICKLSLNEPANADFIAEAGTVAHETGLTPRQLVEQRDELLDEFRRIAEDYQPSCASEAELALSEMREALMVAIAKAEGGEA